MMVTSSQTSLKLSEDANNRLLKRLKDSGYNYTPLECEEVASLNHRLVDPDVNLDLPTIERLRALASLSQTKLVSEKISSHRKIIGPFIVGVKKLILPFINAHIKSMVKAQREFNERLLEQQIISLNVIERSQKASIR